MKLHLVDPKTLTPEIFRVFGTQNALVTAGDQSGCNTMTVGWCQLGRLWNQPVCTVYVRPVPVYVFLYGDAGLFHSIGAAGIGKRDHEALRQQERPGN